MHTRVGGGGLFQRVLKPVGEGEEGLEIEAETGGDQRHETRVADAHRAVLRTQRLAQAVKKQSPQGFRHILAHAARDGLQPFGFEK